MAIVFFRIGPPKEVLLSGFLLLWFQAYTEIITEIKKAGASIADGLLCKRINELIVGVETAEIAIVIAVVGRKDRNPEFIFA